MTRITTASILAAANIDGLDLVKEDDHFLFTNDMGEHPVYVAKLSALSLEQWVAEAQNLAIVEEDEDLPNSVVSSEYKAKYRERALSMSRKPKDVALKALKRSTCDWLAIELARRTLDEKQVLKVRAFEEILDANGVPHAHWNRTTKGWQGRLRMTGRLALQRRVAENGELALPDGTAVPAPKVWIAKHQH